MPSYNIDREKYGLPAGATDPQYTAEKWALSKCMAHCREASKHFGAHVADLFAVALGTIDHTDPVGGFYSQLERIAAGGYLSNFVDAFGEFDVVDSFKRMSFDGRLRRLSPDGTMCLVYADGPEGKADAFASANVNGIEMYYAGQPEVVVKLWWAMLCENCRPFASLHDRIAAVLQPKSPARS